MTSRFAIAKDRVIDALDDIVPDLFGSGRTHTQRQAGRWCVANRWRANSKLNQMTVWRQGGRRGAWKDFVSGEKGDAIDLVAYGLTGSVTAENRMKALEWIEDRFGIRNLSPEKQRELAEAAEKRAAEVAAEAQRKAESDRTRARKFFYSCEPAIAGTPVEAYLNSRGIELGDVPHLTTAFRFHPACDYWPGRPLDGEGNKIGEPVRFPAMIAMMVTGSGKIGACHYTFLEPDGGRKLDTARRGFLDEDGKPTSAKLMYPSSQGCFVPVTHGPSGMNARDALAAGTLDWWGWTEGIEDALSAAIATPRLRMNAAGSLSALLAIPNHGQARGHLLFKDNDWGKPQAQALFDRALARARSFGKPALECAMPAEWGKDVNDALRGDFHDD